MAVTGFLQQCRLAVVQLVHMFKDCNFVHACELWNLCCCAPVTQGEGELAGHAGCSCVRSDQ
jgi:hypothetical protein